MQKQIAFVLYGKKFAPDVTYQYKGLDPSSLLQNHLVELSAQSFQFMTLRTCLESDSE
jgi:hypothetical protein